MDDSTSTFKVIERNGRTFLWSDLSEKHVAEITVCSRTGHTTEEWYDQQDEWDWYDHCEELEVEPSDHLAELMDEVE